MSRIVDAVYENGVRRPLGSLELAEHRQVRVAVEVASDVHATRAASGEDPLASVRIATGLRDLAEHFDDYRFGRRRP